MKKKKGEIMFNQTVQKIYLLGTGCQSLSYVIFSDEFNLTVHGRLAQCIKDIHHWNMLKEIYLSRVGELNERTYITGTC